MKALRAVLVPLLVLVSLTIPASPAHAARINADPCGYTRATANPPVFNSSLNAWGVAWKGWTGNCPYGNIYMHGVLDGALIDDRWPTTGDKVCTASQCISPTITTFVWVYPSSYCTTFYFFLDTGPTEYYWEESDCFPDSLSRK